MFEFVLFLVIFVFHVIIIIFIFAPPYLPSLGSLVSWLPHQLDIEMLVWFFGFGFAAFFFTFLFFLPPVWSCRAVLLLVHHMDIS